MNSKWKWHEQKKTVVSFNKLDKRALYFIAKFNRSITTAAKKKKNLEKKYSII